MSNVMPGRKAAEEARAALEDRSAESNGEAEEPVITPPPALIDGNRQADLSVLGCSIIN
jgi:hypothetical protein